MKPIIELMNTPHLCVGGRLRKHHLKQRCTAVGWTSKVQSIV